MSHALQEFTPTDAALAVVKSACAAAHKIYHAAVNQNNTRIVKMLCCTTGTTSQFSVDAFWRQSKPLLFTLTDAMSHFCGAAVWYLSAPTPHLALKGLTETYCAFLTDVAATSTLVEDALKRAEAHTAVTISDAQVRALLAAIAYQAPATNLAKATHEVSAEAEHAVAAAAGLTETDRKQIALVHSISDTVCADISANAFTRDRIDTYVQPMLDYAQTLASKKACDAARATKLQAYQAQVTQNLETALLFCTAAATESATAPPEYLPRPHFIPPVPWPGAFP